MPENCSAVRICASCIKFKVQKVQRHVDLMHGVTSDFVRPNAPDEGSPMGAEPSGMYARKTQSPVVWRPIYACRVYRYM